MSKEFKNFDSCFTQKQIDSCRRQYGYYCRKEVYEYCPIENIIFDNDSIRYAVYFAPDAISWQLFRVALKGISTNEKINMLVSYQKHNTSSNDIIRIANYIGALKRGGQLDKNLKIVR